MATVCVVTGSRADYGLLQPVMKAIRTSTSLALQLAATGSHFASEFGATVREIEQDGFSIDARVDALEPGDGAREVTRSMGRGVIGFADAFAALRPDLALVLGDRYEILAAAQAALVARIPLAHVAGGDVTEGAFDDAIRHAITKMSHLHFVTNEAAAERVRRMGEDPKHVFNVGSPGLDALRETARLPRGGLEAALGAPLRERNLLVTFHPATLDVEDPARQLSELVRALDALGEGFGVFFTKANADPAGRTLNRIVEGEVRARPHWRLFDSLGRTLYFSLMEQVDAVVGNSSSGLYEAPSLRTPTVNIGDRQKGRLRAASVVDCAPRAADIERAIRSVLDLDCSAVVNPYGDGQSARRIAAILASMGDFRPLLRKTFHDA